MIIAGIDPGKSGAIAIIETDPVFIDPPKITNLNLCPTVKVGRKTEYDVNAMRNLLTPDGGIREVWIEKVHSMPVEFKYRGKVRKQGGASIFSFGKGYGLWLGLIAGLWIEVHEVAPQTWKKFWLRDMPKEKGSSILRVQQLFPRLNLKPTERSRKPSEALAEAILIAMYGAKQPR